MSAVSEASGYTQGLLHHHFSDKGEMIEELFAQLEARFKERVSARKGEATDSSQAYLQAALQLDQSSDLVAARCWVGLFGEALRNPRIHRKARAFIDAQLERISALPQAYDRQESHAILAYLIGALVLGALSPRGAPGFGVRGAMALLQGLRVMRKATG